MGYIIPVTQYQYMQYSNRDIGTGVAPIQTYPIERVKVITGEENDHEEQSFTDDKVPFQFTNRQYSYKKVVDEKLIEKVYGEITGKGSYYSECI